MSSFITSYVGLFQPRDDVTDAVAIEEVEIPLIQRDYAQGREDPEVAQIRADFLNVLCDAVTGGAPAGLDFVYGDVRAATLRPLDGQQRLTTLFLLHWYVAFRTGRLSPNLPWTRFRYATRASSELFCERIVANPPPKEVMGPSTWIKDQAWFLHVWRHNPTIQAMLVLVNALDDRLKEVDLESAWANLSDHANPAISFHLLPIEEIGAGDELYVKMNSRGKPLTPFENFKARFEKALEGSSRAAEFAHRVDGVWSDVLWRYRGRNDVVDDEFIRYFMFVTEVAEWQSGKIETGRLEPVRTEPSELLARLPRTIWISCSTRSTPGSIAMFKSPLRASSQPTPMRIPARSASSASGFSITSKRAARPMPSAVNAFSAGERRLRSTQFFSTASTRPAISPGGCGSAETSWRHRQTNSAWRTCQLSSVW